MMQIDFYFPFIVGAYSVTVVAVLTFFVLTLCRYRRAKRQLEQLESSQ